MLRLAAEITKSAYADAMRRHGLLPSTISVITGYAEENLAALDHESSDVPTEAQAHILNHDPDLSGPPDE
ncbi:hypothetical protein EBO15_12700 [Actinomadura harenae]|uniref:Uncharacterized protein n=2 Tax=Actinomadura harenae TaxID=2483351 RepID=A0A3M2MBE0_9ACTN|nr:hypothetical protein EBO15_12700 [Actinomadura harenae]